MRTFSKQLLLLTASLSLAQVTGAFAALPEKDSARVVVTKTTDFRVTGDGKSAHWKSARWTMLTARKLNGVALATRVKLLYSDKGLYFLFDCQDEKLTATLKQDFAALYKEDVVEVFLWPDPSVPIYFEYELSPLNYELPILVPNLNGRFQGWKPWHYQGNKKIQHATSTQAGAKESNASVKGWMAEFFIPYALLNPLVPAPPRKGTQWRGNFYRIDYDHGYATYSWQNTGESFHEFKKFGTLVFE
jgi:hypothetical protein